MGDGTVKPRRHPRRSSARNAPPVRTEAEALTAYLRQQRDGLRYAAHGFDDEQLWLTPTRSALSLGGLLKHVANTEQNWVDMVAGRPARATEEGYLGDFERAAGDTRRTLVAELDRVAAATEEVIAGLPDLGVAVQLAEGPGTPRARATPRAGCCCTCSRSSAGRRGTRTSSASTSTEPPSTS